MNGLSPWAAEASVLFANANLPLIYTKQIHNYTFTIHQTDNALWVLAAWPDGGKLAFRTAYAPGGGLTLNNHKQTEQGITVTLSSIIGEIKVQIAFTSDDYPVLHYTISIIPKADMLVPFWPRDMVVPGKEGKPDNTTGQIHVTQVGTRTGLLYMSLTKPKAGAVMYMQNLTALAGYCEQTETSCAEVVGGQWPELGFALPPATNKPLAAGKEVVIADAYVCFDAVLLTDDAAQIEQYLNMLAHLYLQLPKPQTIYSDWPAITEKGLKDLIESPGCWSQVAGHAYFNAYVSDYATPPEIMVQLAVLLPLLDYVEWSGKSLEVMKTIKEGLPAFYDEKIGTIMRWLPAAADKLEGEEEQKEPMVMDSWYLHHPLLNLSRLALKGDEVARQLFEDSLEFAIKVAHHFKYQWPVFYKMDTLEIVKKETQPGKGGEKDVPGLYAHVMLQAYELTGKKRFLQEAEKAANTLKGLGFELFYQANNTAFSAGALLRLYKITKNDLYKELSYACLANLFRNMHIWECDYGYGKNFPSFFALFPLNDAPYTAVYEEQEVFCALHDYLKHAESEDILPAVKLLTAEFIRYLVNRAQYYYPPELPQEMLSGAVKMGEIDPKLYIALEDLQDGWKQSGTVGQEVYGAGNAFGILPRHYLKVPGESFLIYTDYPTANFATTKSKPVTFTIKGDERLTCRLMVINTDKSKLPAFTVTLKGQKEALKGKTTKEGHLEYILPGNQTVKMVW